MGKPKKLNRIEIFEYMSTYAGMARMENICTPEQYVAEFNSCEEEIGGRGERMQQGDMGDSSVLKRGDLLRKGSGKMMGGC